MTAADHNRHEGPAIQAGRPPRVAIGMPVRNGAATIGQALAALLSSTFEDFRLFISDNASTDETQSICESFAAADPRVTYWRLAEPVDVYTNFNRLLFGSSSTYFMWAAHDDLHDRRYVESCVGQLEQSPASTLAFTQFDNLDSDGRIIRTYDENWGDLLGTNAFERSLNFVLADEASTQKANHIYGLIRRDRLEAIGGMSIHARPYSGEDLVTLARLLQTGPFSVVQDTLFHYRVRAWQGRAKQAWLSYVANRIFRAVPGHRGNLVSFALQDMTYYGQLRRVFWNNTQLTLANRLTLDLACRYAQARRLTQGPIRAIKAELVARRFAA